MNFKARLLCALAVLLMATLIACGGSEESAPEPSAGGTPAAVPQASDAANPPPSSSRKNPEVLRALPSNFPEDIPLYKDADVAFSRASADMAVSVRLFSDDAPSDVVGYYSDDFAAKGWATDIRVTPEGTLIIAPTHSSNMDSIVLGFALEASGLPPCTYGAGKNLFTNRLISFFIVVS